FQTVPNPLLEFPLNSQTCSPQNQTAVVDKARSTVTYYITSRSNLSAVVLYDSRNGYVCYKPLEQRACYLRRMEPWDLQMALNTSEHSLPGDSAGPKHPWGPQHCSHCCPCSLAGPGRQRLIYLCIDICFPSNICVSICFYYLPE
uniref:BRICHOS domain-containing protein n=1 Tax=Junco hyemalis TaxID=40217 RepID=A0A8C5IL16_JUNHY